MILIHNYTLNVYLYNYSKNACIAEKQHYCENKFHQYDIYYYRFYINYQPHGRRELSDSY